MVAAQNGIPWWYFHGLEGRFDRAPHRGGRSRRGGTEAIPPQRAIGCIVYAGTELEAPGIVRHREGTRFTVGNPTGRDRSAARGSARRWSPVA